MHEPENEYNCFPCAPNVLEGAVMGVVDKDLAHIKGAIKGSDMFVVSRIQMGLEDLFRAYAGNQAEGGDEEEVLD